MLASHYAALWRVHVACVVTSISLFVLRGLLRMAGSGWPDARLLRVLPHLVDTLLLASAVGLAMAVQQYPLVDGWLTAKLAGLVAYVVLGSIALRRGSSPALRVIAFAAALASVAFIVGTAVHRDPDPRRW